jgi:hypothetical protein
MPLVSVCYDVYSNLFTQSISKEMQFQRLISGFMLAIKNTPLDGGMLFLQQNGLKLVARFNNQHNDVEMLLPDGCDLESCRGDEVPVEIAHKVATELQVTMLRDPVAEVNQ